MAGNPSDCEPEAIAAGGFENYQRLRDWQVRA